MNRSSKSRLRSVAALALLCGLLCERRAPAQTARQVFTLSLTAVADELDGSGQSWDPMGGLPDLVLCIESAEGTQCLGRGEQPVRSFNQLLGPHCSNALRCEFLLAASLPLQATFWDLDVGLNDRVGRCFVASRGTQRCGRATLTTR